MENKWIQIEKRIMDILSMKESLTTSQIGKNVNIHPQTAKKHLDLMKFHGIVEFKTNGRIKLWSLKSGGKE